MPAAPLPQVPIVDPRPKMESAFERKIRQEVRERVEKAQRHFEQAQADFKEKRYVSADSNAKMALQFDPKNEDYQKWYNSVKTVLEESIVGNILRKGELAELSHDYKAALESYEHALSLFPENLAGNKALGIVLLAKGDPNVKRAKECLTKVMTAKPKDLDVIVNLVKALRLMGMTKNAQRVLEQAKELNAKDPRIAEEAKELKKLK
jgi:tetratricopeptide (TPR) repeat protein